MYYLQQQLSQVHCTKKKGRKKPISLTNCELFQLHVWTLLVPYFFMSVYPSSQTDKVIPTLWT